MSNMQRFVHGLEKILLDEVGSVLKAVNILLILVSVNHGIDGVSLLLLKKWMQNKMATVKLIYR